MAMEHWSKHYLLLGWMEYRYKQKLDGNLPANPVNDRRIANAVTKDGSTVRYVQNLRTTCYIAFYCF